MTEWKLFDGTEPACSTIEFFETHPWVPPECQTGHAQRMEMVAKLIRSVLPEHQPASISDLGCGDGSLLGLIAGIPVSMWGYDMGAENISMARARGLDVRRGDILSDEVEFGELIVCCEVVEHLAHPHEFLRGLPGSLLIVSSPSAETDEWHYADHTWAWDLDGYAALVEGGGWSVVRHVECDGGVNWHGGVEAPQRFQAIFAQRGV